MLDSTCQTLTQESKLTLSVHLVTLKVDSQDTRKTQDRIQESLGFLEARALASQSPNPMREARIRFT